MSKKKKYISKFVGTPYYIAPEIFKSKYNKSVDIWSCGVIMYVLLSGMTPFCGATDKEIYENIQHQDLVFNQKLDNVSSDAKDLLTRMLTKNFKERISIKDALDHSWFRVTIKKNESLSFNSDSNEYSDMRNVNPIHLKNLLKFRYKSKMQEILYKFFVNHITSKIEREVYPYTFCK